MTTPSNSITYMGTTASFLIPFEFLNCSDDNGTAWKIVGPNAKASA